MQNLKILLLVILAASLSVSCGILSSSDSHIDANGVILTVDGEEFARQVGTTVTYTTGDAINLIAGEQTGMISVSFLNSDNEEFTPEGDDYFLKISVSDESVVRVAALNGTEFMVNMSAEAEGETEVQFEIFHVDHSDFTSRPFRFVVDAPPAI